MSRRHVRPEERGAAIFVVVLVVTLLTALGVFAIRTTSFVTTAAGHNRRAAQSTHVAEACGKVGFSYSADRVGLLQQVSASGSGECVIGGSCGAFSSVEMNADIDQLAGEAVRDLFAPQGETPGSLGPPLVSGEDGTALTQGVEGVCLIELSGGARVTNLAGHDSSKTDLVPQRFLYTIYAQTRPVDGSSTGPLLSTAESASLRVLRAVVVYPVVPR